MKSIVIGTAGHIDHGKSALVQALTGVDPDRLKEEKARGITIELGFAHYEDDEIDVAFVDVPGHERFVKNMLAGATGIDVLLLVVASDESVMPQTREHFDICRLLGISQGIIALTKSDLVDEETRELVSLETRELVAGSFLASAPIVPVSAKTGDGLEALRRELRGAAGRATGRATSGAARLPIDRVFSMKGFGTVVTGTLVSGRIRVDEERRLLPADRAVKVRGIQVHGRTQPEVVAGQRTALNLGGVDLADVTRGETLADPGCFEPTRRFDGDLNLLADARPLRHGARVRFHQGTSEILGRVAISIADVDAQSAGAPATEVRPGTRAYVRIRLERPAVLTRGDRFILRAYSPSITIGGGRVLDPHPPRGGTRTDRTRERFRRLDRAGVGTREREDEAAFLMIEERAEAGLPLDTLTPRLGMAPGHEDETATRLGAGGRVLRVGDLLIATDVIRTLESRLLAELRAYHAREPLSDGLAREEARERLFGRAEPGVFDHAISGLVASGRLVARDRLALATHRLSLSEDETRAQEAIVRVLQEAGLKPPDTGALATSAGCSPEVVDRVLKLLLRQRVLVRIDALVFHADALDRLKQDTQALKAAGVETIDVGAFKERHHVSRKYAIPLLEYLDRERVTRRVGEKRVVI